MQKHSLPTTRTSTLESYFKTSNFRKFDIKQIMSE